MVAMGGLDRFVGNETGPPQAARRVKARDGFHPPRTQHSKWFGVAGITAMKFN